MSQQLISRSRDLQRLRDDGYDVEIRSSYLLVKGVPYVNSAKEVKRGIIASVLDLAGETTMPPETHVIFFAGEPPCDEHGAVLPGVSQNANQALGDGLTPNHQISRVPKTGPNPLRVEPAMRVLMEKLGQGRGAWGMNICIAAAPILTNPIYGL